MLTTDEADISVNCHFVNSQKKVRRRLCEKMASEKRGGDVAYSPLNDNSNPSDGEDSSSDIRMDDRGGTSRFKMLIFLWILVLSTTPKNKNTVEKKSQKCLG